jgi:hypothetical protein
MADQFRPGSFVEQRRQKSLCRSGRGRARCLLQLLHARAQLPNLVVKLRQLLCVGSCDVLRQGSAVRRALHQHLVHATQRKRGNVQAVLFPKLRLDADGSAIDFNNKLVAVTVNHGVHSKHIRATVRQRCKVSPALELIGQRHNLQVGAPELRLPPTASEHLLVHPVMRPNLLHSYAVHRCDVPAQDVTKIQCRKGVTHGSRLA